MAQEIVKSVSLQLVYVSGMNEHGDNVLKRKTYNNIGENAGSEDLLTIAMEIAKLQEFPLHEVNTSQTKRLEE